MKRFVFLIVILLIAGPLWLASESLGPIAVGYRMGGTMPIGDVPIAMGSEISIVAGYGKDFAWGSLAGMVVAGVGTIGTNTEDLFSAGYSMTMVPVGLTARYTTRSATPFYALAEVSVGVAFLEVTYLGDPDFTGREPENYQTSWSATGLGGGYRIRSGLAIEMLAGLRGCYFKERVLAQISAQAGLILIPHLLGPDGR